MPISLDIFSDTIDGFSEFTFAEKIRVLGWYLHVHAGKTHFMPADIKKCFDEMHFACPSSIAPFFAAMVSQKPPQLLKEKLGYRLERRIRDKYDGLYGSRASTKMVGSLLSELPNQIANIDERSYLGEAILCLKVSAFRAAIIMTWNMAFDHFCHWIFAKHLSAFNQQLPKTYPKAGISSLSKLDDFSELKESQVLQVAASCGIITANIHKIMKEKLDRRNIAAHPSSVVIEQLTAEEFVRDVVINVVSKMT